jgi:hypothetical protein
MLQGRRKVLALLAVLGVAFVAPGVSSGQDTAAGAFLESLTHDVFTKLDDTSLSQTEKERDLRNLFRQNFDTPAISRFVLARDQPLRARQALARSLDGRTSGLRRCL